ncbi:MAG: glutamate synthase central domain-containing protein, partial [Candidatus Gracilibacteria bacterium]
MTKSPDLAYKSSQPENPNYPFHVDDPDRHGGCGIAAVASLKGAFSHRIVEQVMRAGVNMEHRGGKIGGQSDGAGIILKPNGEFFKPHISPGMHLPDGEELIVGDVWFMPETGGDTLKLQHQIDGRVIQHGLKSLGWRKVPVESSVLPAHIQKISPEFWQLLMGRGMMTSPQELRKMMYLLRNTLGGEIAGTYFPDFTPDTIVYKNLCNFDQLADVFPDLKDPRFEASAAMMHRRYSTNTVPRFRLAQPFAILAHNGEINTNMANMNAVKDLERALPLFFKVLMRQGSDSANVDRLVELFLAHGVSLPETLRRFMMPPWRDIPHLPEEQKTFYEAVRRSLGNLAVLEGPAAIAAMTGDSLVAILDKMGLRPLRFWETNDGEFGLASEMGAIPLRSEDIRYVRQLGPGQMVMVNLKTGEVVMPDQVEERIRDRSPLNYKTLSTSRILVPEESAQRFEFDGQLASRLSFFGWTKSRKSAVEEMIKNGKEPITSMGYSYPLAVFSENHPPLSKYFKQIIAVVTNPSIDPLREDGAFDLTTYLGSRPKISLEHHGYDVRPQHKFDTPFLTDSELTDITKDVETLDKEHPNVTLIDITFPRGTNDKDGTESMKAALLNVRDKVLEFVNLKKGGIIVLSDRKADENNLPLPSILVSGIVNNSLKDRGLRRNVSIVMDTGEVQEPHDAAVLFAHGVDAVNPYMMWHIAYAGENGDADQSESERVKTLRNALNIGLKRIMSKMGITTLDGYRDSQLFEAVGIDTHVMGYYLPGTSSYLGGIGMEEIYSDIAARCGVAQSELPKNKDVSAYRKDVYCLLQEVARGDDPEAYAKFLAEVRKIGPTYLRDLLKFKDSDSPIAVDEVGSAKEII